MKGLAFIPSSSDLAQAYEHLQTQVIEAPVEQWALWSQWCRLDPRLAEQWIEGIFGVWEKLSPVELNSKLKNQPWPAAAGVLLEQAQVFFLDSSLPSLKKSRASLRLFRRWCACVMTEIGPANDELFFLGLRSFAGSAAVEDAEKSLKPYLRWGFLGREVLRNKAMILSGKRTWTPRKQRILVLTQILRNQGRITVSDYLQALDGTVGRRQAELDLAQYAIPMGQTRNRYYRAKKRRS